MKINQAWSFFDSAEELFENLFKLKNLSYTEKPIKFIRADISLTSFYLFDSKEEMMIAVSNYASNIFILRNETNRHLDYSKTEYRTFDVDSKVGYIHTLLKTMSKEYNYLVYPSKFHDYVCEADFIASGFFKIKVRRLLQNKI